MTTLSQVIKKFPTKLCLECNNKYIPTGPAAKFCIECATIKAKECKARSITEYRKRNGVKVGIGRGRANTSGVNDSQYTTGIRYFKRRRQEIKAERKCCERCKKNLLHAKSGQWVVHHKDYNRTHNTDDNFELLCKRCHQLEHDCTAHLPN